MDDFERVALIGLGVMGGSLARALGSLPDPPRIRGCSNSGEELERALDEGVIDRGSTDGWEVVADADLIVYATPPAVTLELIRVHRSHWPSGSIVTDVVSLKTPVLEVMEELGEGERYVGSHPMAGDQRSGFPYSRGDLFRGARVWLVATTAPREARDRIRALWSALGARPSWIDAREHDRRMGWVSHLPQLAATGVALALAEAGIDPQDLGSGGRDVVRLAGSGPEMWSELLAENRKTDLGALEGLVRALKVLAEALRKGGAPEIAGEIARGRRWLEDGEA